MRFKRFCVTVMDNWTPLLDFCTYEGALKFRNEHLASAHLHQWFGGRWVEVMGPPGDRSISINPLAARCYTLSEPHLSGYRLILGFNSLDEVSTAQQYLCGEHTLMAVQVDVRHPFDVNAAGAAIQLDQDMTVFVYEDPSDGYRSCAIEPMVVRAPLYSFGCSPTYLRVPVLVRKWEKSDCNQADGIEIIDTRNGKTILYAGTDNFDDYYPSYTFDWRPQDLADNAAVQPS